MSEGNGISEEWGLCDLALERIARAGWALAPIPHPARAIRFEMPDRLYQTGGFKAHFIARELKNWFSRTVQKLETAVSSFWTTLKNPFYRA